MSNFVMFRANVLLLVLILLLWYGIAQAYNIDTAYPLKIAPERIRNSNSSSFGFSLAFFSQYGDNQRRQNLQRGLLVGSPTGTDSRESRSDYRPGSLSFCTFPSDNGERSTCTALTVDRDQNEVSTLYSDGGRTTGTPYIPLRDKSLLGFSVATERTDLPGKAIVCAPRWISVKLPDKRQNPTNQKTIYLPNGLCYALVPGRARPFWSKMMAFTHGGAQGISDNVSLLAQAQSGFAVQFAKDGRDVLISAPGYWNGIGTIAHSAFLTDESSTNVKQSRPKILFSNVVQQYCQDEDSCYLGYSVSSGYILGYGELHYASGMPRANSHGMVVVYKRPGAVNATRKLPMLDENLDPVFFLMGTQFQESFGYSVLILDINNDGRDDIIVGAPHAESSDKGYGDGLVYTFLSSASWDQETDRWSKNDTEAFLHANYHIAGHDEEGAMFGSCLTSLGDIDEDGFNDFAIGSPFGASGGSVYVVYGGADPEKAVSSRLTSPVSNQASSQLSSFGFSAAGNTDIDRNTVLDIAVGDFTSESVYLFRGQHTLTWTMEISLRASSHQALLITRDRQALVLSSCMNLTLHTSGQSVGSKQTLRITIILDRATDTWESRNGSRRAVFRENQNSSFVYFRPITPAASSEPENSCEILDIDVDSQWYRSMEVVKTPLSVSMSAVIVQSISQAETPEREFCPTCYVLSPSAPRDRTVDIPFVQCRPGNGSCKGQVEFALNNMTSQLPTVRVVQGHNTTFVLTYTLTNLVNSVPLYLPRLRVAVPQNMTVERIELLSDSKAYRMDSNHTQQHNTQEVSDTPPRHSYEMWIPLGLSQAFYPETSISFQVTFEASRLLLSSTTIDLTESVLESSLEHTLLDRPGTLQVIQGITTLVNFTRAYSVHIEESRSSLPEELRPVVKNNKIDDASSLHFNQTFEVFNFGPSEIPVGSVVFVAIPTATQSETYIAVETVELSTRAMVVQCATSNRSDLQGGMTSEPESNTTVTAHGTTEKHFLDCSYDYSKCTIFECELPAIASNSKLTVLIKAMLLEEKLKFSAGQQGLLMLSLTTHAVLVLPSEITAGANWEQIPTPKGDYGRFGEEAIKTIKIFFHNDKLPNWIIFAAICGSLCLLLLLTTLLVLFGFFRRKQLSRTTGDGEQETIIEVSEGSEEQGGFAIDKDFHVAMTDNPVYDATPNTPTYEEIPNRLPDSPLVNAAP